MKNPEAERVALLEYFCTEGDSLWRKSTQRLIEQAKHEVELLGLVASGRLVDGAVMRVVKGYPVYDRDYVRGLEQIRCVLRGVPSLQLVGRNGMHCYNSQDHSC
jgi:protoporphyrinogen oxidase